MNRVWLRTTVLCLCLTVGLLRPTVIASAQADTGHALLAQLGGASYAVHVADGAVLVGMGPNLYSLPAPSATWSPCGVLRVRDVVQGITSQDGYAYVAAGADGLRVVSVADPCALWEVASLSIPGTVSAVAVAHGYAYLAAGSSGIAVIDIHDPTHPTLSQLVPLTGQAQHITIAGRFAYVAAGYGALRVLDLGEPAHPQEAGAYLQVYEALSVAIVGDYAYLAAGEDGLKILSLQNPKQPTLVTSQAIEDGFATAVAVGTDSTGQATYAYIAAREGGVRVISVHNPGAPVEVDPLSAPGLPTDILLEGPQLYVAAGPGGAHAFDLDAGVSPELIHSFGIVSDARDVARVGSHYIVATGMLGVQSVSWHDNRLDLVDTISIPGEAVRLAPSGTDVYVASRNGGLCVLSAADPRELLLTTCLPGPGPANGVAVQGALAYVACDVSGLWIVDVTRPDNPVPVAEVDTPGQAMHTALMDGHALIADGDRGMRVIAITEPSAAQEVGRHFETPGHATSIAIAGDHAFLADGAEGLHIISMVDPLDPQIVGTEPLPGFAFEVQVLDSLAFVGAERAGLQIISADVLELPAIRGSVSLPGATTGLYVEQPEGPVFAAARDAGLLVIDARPARWICLPLVQRAYSE